MQFTRLTPSVFYKDVATGLKTFVECLEFSISHDEINSENPFCVVKKDNLSVMVFQSEEYAEKEHPEHRLVTNGIEEVYQRVALKFPELLHPNLSKVTLRPWGAQEFALPDGQIGIIVQQW